MTARLADPPSHTIDPLDIEAYKRHPHQLARHLLGRNLVRIVDGKRLVGRIVEVEVYGYERDGASHADSGEPTERTAAMFGEPGTAYVYLIYGMYHCLNVVAPSGERPSAILVRALRPLEGVGEMAHRRGLADESAGELTESVRRNLASGPGKLCQAMAIDTRFNGMAFDTGSLVIGRGEPAVADPRIEIAQAPRIGLNPSTVGDAYHWKWRYGIARSKYLSKPLISG